MKTKTKFNIKRGITIKPEQIEPNPWNVNKTTQRQQEAIAESLEAYGQLIEVLVRPHPEKKDKYQIIDGEHRYLELKERAEPIVVNVVDLPEVDAKKLSIILNETRGQADTVELSQLISEIKLELIELGEEDTLITALPYTEEELAELSLSGEYDWDSFENAEDYQGDDSNNGLDDGYQKVFIILEDHIVDRLNELTKNPTNSQKATTYGAYISQLIS